MTIHEWFSLSRASYLVIQRSLLEGMPMEWQEKFVAMIEEMNEIYDTDAMNSRFLVRMRGDNGKFVSDPYMNYRHPPKLPYRNREGGKEEWLKSESHART